MLALALVLALALAPTPPADLCCRRTRQTTGCRPAARNPIGAGAGRRDSESVIAPAGVIRPILLPKVFRKPQVAVRSARYSEGVSSGRRDSELGDYAGRGNPPDFVARALRKPQVAVRSARYSSLWAPAVGIVNSVITPAGVIRPILCPSIPQTTRCHPVRSLFIGHRLPRRDGEFGNCAGRGNRPILLPKNSANSVNHSYRPVRPQFRRGQLRPSDSEFGDYAGRGNPPDLVAGGLRKPQVAVRSARYSTALGAVRRDSEFSDYAGRGNPPDLLPVPP